MSYHAYQKKLSSDLIDQLTSEFSVEKGILSSVRTPANEKMLKKYNFLPFSHLTPLPLTLNYKTPETLGLDRIAATVGALAQHKKADLLIIDMGTCVTYDFVNRKKEYRGGSISPGFQMRFNALTHFTGKLPKVAFKKQEVNLIGNTTENAMISGVYHGLKKELEGIIKAYSAQYKELKIVVTGGDAGLFDLEPKNRIFADQFLVLKGLNEILNYNGKK